ncbi:Nif3-like dinuclear metal center hexameric protein [Rubinisphaera margarita]|uniref:Nif3-like dinuclear metal center hexameric protein n=1 Tax=Rubinisphaera margarita TaxID=2909586 RepID=UPI001EE78641|nr:Nif3-like dinuclear metal center hexameric protein [Rubinisphaera margarita]MCG6157447.1 Nif3-like dinuclear metal center hexameric protein [Rubinisphaera margarita]
MSSQSDLTVVEYLQQFAPLDLSESWDNVGVLLGDPAVRPSRLMTCLTLTPDVATEAIEKQVGLIVTHHPVLFRAVQRLTTESAEGRMLLDLIRNEVSVYSPHTAFDSAAEGINQQWCERLQLRNCKPLRPLEEIEARPARGAGRHGDLPEPLTFAALLEQIRRDWTLDYLQFVGNREQTVSRIGVACGAAAEFMKEAAAAECQVLITGEARFHACLEARQRNIGLILVGHFASERFACEKLATILGHQFPNIECFASEVESDPVSIDLPNS